MEFVKKINDKEYHTCECVRIEDIQSILEDLKIEIQNNSYEQTDILVKTRIVLEEIDKIIDTL